MSPTYHCCFVCDEIYNAGYCRSFELDLTGVGKIIICEDCGGLDYIRDNMVCIDSEIKEDKWADELNERPNVKFAPTGELLDRLIKERTEQLKELKALVPATTKLEPNKRARSV
jgi:hypothetical protein